MSDGYYPKNSNTSYQSLKVEGLDISGSDATLYTIAGGNLYINVLEPVTQVYLASVKVDSSNTVTQFAQSSIVIVDSVAYTPGGDMGAIQITGLAALAANDCLSVKYTTQE